MTTMTPSLNANITALLQAGADTFAKVEANTGEGFLGEWPPEGEHTCFLDNITVVEATIKLKSGELIPCVRVQFAFEVIPDESDVDYNPDTPGLSWKGVPFNLTTLEAVPNDDHPTFPTRRRVEVDWERLKGHLSKCLGKTQQELMNPMVELSNLMAIVENTKPILKVNVQHRKANNGKTYKTEYIKDQML